MLESVSKAFRYNRILKIRKSWNRVEVEVSIFRNFVSKIDVSIYQIFNNVGFVSIFKVSIYRISMYRIAGVLRCIPSYPCVLRIIILKKPSRNMDYVSKSYAYRVVSILFSLFPFFDRFYFPFFLFSASFTVCRNSIIVRYPSLAVGGWMGAGFRNETGWVLSRTRTW